MKWLSDIGVINKKALYYQTSDVKDISIWLEINMMTKIKEYICK